MNRSVTAARAAANPSITGRHQSVTVLPPERVNAGGWQGQSKRNHKRPGRDKGQGLWRTVPASCTVGRWQR